MSELNVGAEIKKYLMDNGISQSFVARRAEIDIPKLNMSLNGGRGLSLEEYASICGALGVNTDRFLPPIMPGGGSLCGAECGKVRNHAQNPASWRSN